MYRKSTQVERICHTCGNTFLASTVEVNRRGAKYCGRKCYYASLSITFDRQVQLNTGPANESGCTLWMGKLDRHGRGIFYSNLRPPQRLFLAHRIAWELVNGPIPVGLCICHRCDVPACVNVEHLFLGSQLDNIADMERKGRQANRRLSDDAIRIIRDRYAAGGVSQQQLADEYDVHQTCISSVVSGRRWKYVS